MMNLDWSDPVPPERRRRDSIWTKVKNSISVVRPTHDDSGRAAGGSSSRRPSPPRRNSVHDSPRRSSSSTPRHSVAGSSSQTRQRTVSHSASPSKPPQRSFVTVQYGNGPPQPIGPQGGVYGSAYIVTNQPAAYLPKVPSSASKPPTTASHSRRYSSYQVPGAYPVQPPVLRYATPPPLGSRPMVPFPPPNVRRSSATTGSSSQTSQMYNGKLIVGEPANVERYINSQKTIERWRQNVA